MRKFILACILFLSLFLSNETWAQGLNPYLGTSSAKNSGVADVAHTGYVIGADARLNEGKMYFVIGLQYHVLGLLATEDFSLSPEGEKFNFFKLRVGLGYDLFYVNDHFKIRGKTLGSLDNLSGLPPALADQYNETIAGAVLGLGVDFYNITFDVELELGLVNAVNMVDDTQFDFVNFTLGFIF